MSKNQDKIQKQGLTQKQVKYSDQKKYEFVWKPFLIVVTFIAVVLAKKLYDFQTLNYFSQIRKGNIYDLIYYGCTFSVVYTAIDYLIHWYFDDLCLKYFITEERYLQPEKRKNRCYSLVKWGYSLIYYIICTIWAYKIIRETNVMPTWLGGNGHIDNFKYNRFIIPFVTTQMKAFYLIQFGKHFSRFYSHLFLKSEGAFFQYALHHGLSVFLIVFSYLSNYWYFGIMVLFLHDFSDTGLILGRFYRDYRNYSKIVLGLIYYFGFFVWIACRMPLFCYTCIYASFQTILYDKLFENKIQQNVMFYISVFMSFMMICLEVMHIFWTYFIAQSFFVVKVAKKMNHSYD